MPSRRRVCWLTAAALCLPSAFGQLIAQTVIVGANGSFFEPETISAGLNNIVRFVFSGMSHSVVQAAFDNPCIQLPGGFASGVSGVGNNTSAAPPVWDLLITNVTQPIWFYCANTLPSFHCTAGMVGAINPPSIPEFDIYKSAAKLISTVPTVFPTKALSGLGAAATAFPVAPPGASSSTTSTSSTTQSASSTTQSRTQTPTPAAVSSNKGAIIGGSVGGVVALVAGILLVWFCLARRQRQQARNSSEFFNYNIRSPQLSTYMPTNFPTMGHTPADRLPHAQPLSQPSESNLTESNPPTLSPQRRDSSGGRQYRVANDTASTSSDPASNTSRGLPPLPASAAMMEQKSFLSMHTRSLPTPQDAPPPNIHVLAREVAAVMMQNTLDSGSGSRSRSASEDEPSAPPSYVNHR